MRLYLLFSAIFLSSIQSLWSQCTPSASDYLYGPHVKAMIHNGGDMFWDLIGNPGYEVPYSPGNANRVNAAFASSVWIGALDGQGNLHLAGQTYRQAGIDFYSGPYRSTGNYPCNLQSFTFLGDAAYPYSMISLASGKVLVAQPNQVEILDPATGNITNIALPTNRTNYQPVELNDGRVWLVGQDVTPGYMIQPTFMLDTTNWTIQNAITPSFFHYHSTATKLSNGKVLVAGKAGCEVYDPVSNQITAAPAMLAPRSYHSAVLLANGKVMVAGGNQVSFNQIPNLSSTEFYDPLANNWTAGPSMSLNRGLCSMTKVANGKVVIVGGYPGSDRLEVYDPGLNAITLQHLLPGNVDLTSAFLDGQDEVYFTSKGVSSGGSILLMHKYKGSNGALTNTQTHLGKFGAAYLGNDRALLKVSDAGLGTYMLYDTRRDQLIGDRYQKIWKVTRSQIDQFRADFANGTLNFDNYPDILDWPAHGDVNAGEQFYLAPFIDVDGDGRYFPATDGDYPCIKGDNAMWWVYNDDAGQHGETGGQKIGLQFEVMAYTFDCATRTCPDTLLDYATFFHYKVTNLTQDYYPAAYMGLWMDMDLGNYIDDYIGSDTTLDLAFVYNGDDNDETQVGYGIHPPAAGTMILTTPQNIGMTNFMTYNNDFGVNGNPAVANDYYNYLRSVFLDGQHLVNNGLDGYPGTAAGIDVNHFYPGDPGFCGGTSTGWSEVSAGNAPFDRRYLQSFGPFRLSAGEVMEMDMAMLWARDSSNFASVCRLKDLATTVKPWWMAQDSSCPTVILGNEPPSPAQQAQLVLAPNPSQGTTTLIFPEMVTEGQIGIWNSLGQCVYASKVTYGTDRLTLDQPQLPVGVYQIVAEMNGLKMRANWVIAR